MQRYCVLGTCDLHILRRLLYIFRNLHGLWQESTYLCIMKQVKLIYSTEWNDIRQAQKGDCVHLICLKGRGGFLYDNRPVNFKANDILVLSHFDQVENLWASNDIQVEMLIVELRFLFMQLPSNHYGIGGGIALFQDPVISVNDAERDLFLDDIRRIGQRIPSDTHLFLQETIGSMCLTMMYDLFNFHAQQHRGDEFTNRRADLVKQLMVMLGTGITRREREVRYFADKLHVSPKYLSDTVKRQTGSSVMQFIHQYTIPIVREMLNDPQLSISQIADIMNFSSVNYFCRYCSKHLGMNPSEYRLSQQPKENERLLEVISTRI